MSNFGVAINSVISSPLNVVFISLIAVIFVFGLTKRRESKSQFVSSLPSMLISLGILGTFSGIFVGLLGFNENDISGSIPVLLGGMKTAFFTSLCGMASSIILKSYYSSYGDREDSPSDDPIESLQNIEKAIVSCFRSDEEYSLVSQVKLIRQELIDSRRETKESFEKFADQFSKMASESMVQELQSVVDKFNVMLSDLVGESFKELTKSVNELNRWQGEHKILIDQSFSKLGDNIDQVESLLHTLAEATANIKTLDPELQSIATKLNSITASTQEIEKHSNSLATQSSILQESMTAIREVGTEAAKVIPTIAQRMNEITNDIRELQSTTSKFVENITKRTNENLNNFITQSEETQRSTTEFVAKQIQAHETHIANIEESLEKELTQSLNSLTGSLASLSEKFVSDYLPLTDRLKEVVRIAEGARAN